MATYDKKDLLNKEWVVTELEALKDLLADVYNKIDYYVDWQVPESLCGQRDALLEQIAELEEVLY